MGGHARASRRCLVVTLLIVMTACAQNDIVQPAPPSPPAGPPPVPPPPPPPASGVTLSGIVFEVTESGGRRPLANLRLKVLDGSSSGGAVRSVELADTVTDASGRYTIDNVSAFTLWFRTAPGSDYRFPCDAYPVDVKAALRTPPLSDLPAVHTTWSGNRPPGSWIPGTSAGGSWIPPSSITVSRDASRSCSMVPAELKQRHYTADVQQTGAQLKVVLSGAIFLANTFYGHVRSSNEILFPIAVEQPPSWDVVPTSEVVERLGDGSLLIVIGVITARMTPEGIRGTGGAIHHHDESCAIDSFEIVRGAAPSDH
jgi:hypothetical protein